MSPNGDASHSQIWDDSSLVDSWNEALEEYKKYHSIKARGGNFEEALNRAQKTGHQMSVKTQGSQPNKSSHLSGGEVVRDEQEEFEGHPAQGPRTKKGEPSEETADVGITSHEEEVPVVERLESLNRSPALPQHLIGQVHDDGLKNLLMSWYYAGYYTGLHEGKRDNHGA